MSGCLEREKFIPLRRCELVDVLCQEADLGAAELDMFRRFCGLVAAIYHHEFHQLQERIKDAYAPFDPDSDTRCLVALSEEEKLRRLNTLFNELAVVLERADYKHLSAADLEPAMVSASAWGIHTDVDFRVFERLVIFARGDVVEKRQLRMLRRALRQGETDVPIYQRLVLMMKLRPHRRLGRQVDTHKVYFQLFKNTPKLDINMLLPGGRVRMRLLDRGRVVLPILSGLALTLWQVMRDITGAVVHFFHDFILFKPAAVWAAASAAIGYGIKSYYGYQWTLQRYHLNLSQVLYYQNLDTNAGVVYRLLDEAEEQESREAILAYFHLWRHAGPAGWTSAELDEFAEKDLHDRISLAVDFAHDDSLARLEKLQLIEQVEGRYRARPLGEAVARLEKVWQDSHCGDGPAPALAAAEGR